MVVNDGGGGLRCGARGFSRGGNALGFARGGNESHDEDEDLVWGGGGGGGLGLGLGSGIPHVIYALCSHVGSMLNGCGTTVF